jgi:DNA polymerase elongation subunit (family B)
MGDITDDLVFQSIGWHARDVRGAAAEESDGDDGAGYNKPKKPIASKLVVHITGRTADGRTRVMLDVQDFTPFFFVASDRLDRSNAAEVKSALQKLLPWGLREDLVDVVPSREKEFVGFRAGKLTRFFRLRFSSMRCSRAASRILLDDAAPQSGLFRAVRVFESNLDPVLRLMHVKDASPVGWLRVSANKLQDVEDDDDLDGGDMHHYACDWHDLQPIKDVTGDLPALAPFTIAAWDIECSSSHGLFPVARKGYRQTVVELFDAYDKVGAMDGAWAVDALLGAFDGSGNSSCRPLTFLERFDIADIRGRLSKHADEILDILRRRLPNTEKRNDAIKVLTLRLEGVADDDDVEAHGILNKLGFNKGGLRLPKIKGDAVVQIGVTSHLHGRLADGAVERRIYTLGSCDSIEGATVVPCDDEEQLLLGWSSWFGRQLDPDVVMGWNVNGFDYRYIYDRAMELGIWEDVVDNLARIRGEFNGCRYVTQRLSSSALGDNLLRYIDQPGRVMLDLMKVIQRDVKLDTYKLDAVAEKYLGDRKDNVSPADIFRLQRGTSADRCVVARYCLQDCLLCNRLFDKLSVLPNNCGMAIVCSIPLSYAINRGQGIKAFSLVCREARARGQRVPVVKAVEGGGDEEGYEGAIVLDPVVGAYLEEPVAVLDYASLYPSSIISHNLSHDTYVRPEDWARYGALEGYTYRDIEVAPGRTARFVVSGPDGAPVVGTLPVILQKLLAARKATRKQLADEPDPFRRAVLDGLQLAYKITANSMYGSCAARTSFIRLQDIAAATTATGRSMILKAKAFLEEQRGARVVYGDTGESLLTHAIILQTPMLICCDAFLPQIASSWCFRTSSRA